MKPSSDIEISDVTLPIAALLIASVFEELDGSGIEKSSFGGWRLERAGKLATPNGASEGGPSQLRAVSGEEVTRQPPQGPESSEVSQPGPPSCLVEWGIPR
jgi:hypothetical protein